MAEAFPRWQAMAEARTAGHSFREIGAMFSCGTAAAFKGVTKYQSAALEKKTLPKEKCKALSAA